MSRKALKVVVELKFRAVSCPGVHLSDKDDIYLSMCFMGQYRQSESLPAVFPLLFHEKMTFEKIFRHAVDPGDIAVMLEYETIRIDLVQLIPPGGDTLACFEEDARRFLFPEPKLVPSFSGVDREVLMTRAPHFPGIAPRLEFSTKTTIFECSADEKVNFYPNILLRPVMRRSRKSTSRPRTSSPQRRGIRTNRERLSRTRSSSRIFRSQSMSPVRARNSQGLTRLSLDSAAPRGPDHWDSNQPLVSSWPGVGHSASLRCSAPSTSSSSPLNRSSSAVKYSPTLRRLSSSNGLIGGTSEDESSSSETRDPSGLRRSYRELSRNSSSHREWEEVQERVRGLLTTPKAVRRLVFGATHSEVDEVLSRTSVSPGPP